MTADAFGRTTAARAVAWGLRQTDGGDVEHCMDGLGVLAAGVGDGETAGTPSWCRGVTGLSSRAVDEQAWADAFVHSAHCDPSGS
jgi:hypothetical protein